MAIWGILLVGFRLLLFLPHRYLDPVGMINASVQTLLCIVSIQIARNSRGAQRHIYLIFAVFFGFVIPLSASSFIGELLFRENRYANIYYHLYVNKFGMNFIQLFLVLFITADYFLSKRKLSVKYCITFFLTSSILIGLFFPFLLNPLQLYYEKDCADLQDMMKSNKEYTLQTHTPPDDHELASALVNLRQRSGTSSMQFADAIELVRQLRPYMNEGGVTSIFWKPLSLIHIYLNVIVLMIVVIILTATYKFNNVHGAYIDKILIILFLSSALEILHTYGFIHSDSVEKYHALFTLAQYFTILSLLLMVYAFDLRLRFVLSSTGQYYEGVLETSPGKVTRWRDEIDNLILKAFSKNYKYLDQIGYMGHIHQQTKEITK